MNKQGELSMGGFVMLAVGIILGIVFLVAIADNQQPLTNTASVSNQTVTLPADGETLVLNGQAVVGSVVVMNGSTIVGAGNYSVANFVQSDGGYRAVLTVLDDQYEESAVNVTYTYQPVGYNADAGSRGIWVIVSVFFALAVFSLALPGVREWLKN